MEGRSLGARCESVKYFECPDFSMAKESCSGNLVRAYMEHPIQYSTRTSASLASGQANYGSSQSETRRYGHKGYEGIVPRYGEAPVSAVGINGYRRERLLRSDYLIRMASDLLCPTCGRLIRGRCTYCANFVYAHPNRS